MASTAFLNQAYLAYFGRPVDTAGAIAYANATDAKVMADFSASPESIALYGSTFNLVQVNGIYQTLFGRDAELVGATYWLTEVASGRQTPASAAVAILNGALGNDKVIVANKLAASATFTANLDTIAEALGYSGAAAAGSARAYLGTVTLTAATPEAVTTATAAAVSVGTAGINAGMTFTLTDSTDVLTGTSGNDNFIAGTKAGAATLTGGDVVAGGAGADTITLVDNVNAAAFAGANVTSVETVSASFSATDATLNVSANAGVTQVNVGNSIITSVGAAAGVATVTLAKAQKAGINGTITNDNTTNNAANISTVTFAFSDVTGGADAATLALNGASFVKNAANLLGATSGVTIAGVETLTIEATGKNTIGVLTAAQTSTLNVSGAGSLSATAAGGTFKVVDASANTGGVTLNIAALAAADLKVTGGTGNDEITIDYGNLTKLDTINLGAGIDTLGFATTNVDFTTTALVGALAGVTNVEGLKANGGIEFAANAALLTQTNFIINSTGKATLTGFATADTLTFGGVAAAASTVALELGQNTVNLTLAGTTAAASNVTNGLTVTGSSVINLVSSGTSGVANNVLAITTGDNNAFNVTGSQNLTLTVVGAGGVTGQTVNAATFAGKLTVTGTALADTIIGGTGADTITGGAGADKMTGGAGADTFVFDAANKATQSGAVFGSFDTITDFVVGTDKLQFTNSIDVVSVQQAGVQAAVTALAAGSSATAIANAMAGANTTDLGVSFAVYGGDTYVFFEASGAGTGVVANDVFIKLTGVTTAPTFAADVVA